jgi:Fic family protein
LPGWGFDDDEPDERTLVEAANGRAQARAVSAIVRRATRRPAVFPVTTIELQILNRLAMQGLLATAGDLRQRDVKISGSSHVPPPYAQVPFLLSKAFDFVNSQPNADPLFLSAYVLWRICWIHPFEDGNGRTARAVSYLVLSVRLGFELPGKTTIPTRIKHAPIAYARALEAADRAWIEGRLDVAELRKLLAFYLEAQMRDDPPGLPPGA